MRFLSRWQEQLKSFGTRQKPRSIGSFATIGYRPGILLGSHRSSTPIGKGILNPLIRRSLYHGYISAWRDADDFSALVSTKRISLCKALEKNADVGLLQRLDADDLKETVERAHISLFYPLLYRIDMNAIDPGRRNSAVGSGARGSDECLIVDFRKPNST
jgi:hypothetical protein